ncbi:Gfo/Idh/MocA family protein [Ensifer aridi]|uniref:Gfo/Idh/MocA family protein n=1 Tax=Ensifer aridi TaxID=1708715 RepID=UPI0004041183|nr:Gfo/Idh/MocA family oxidoreductase [Ensifer aridi]
MVRLIQIGLGDWGVNWATTIVPQVPEVEIAGYVVRSQDKAEISRERLGERAAPFFLSLEEAIERTGADGVLVLTTTAAHVELVSRALALGRHVLVEKPFVQTIEEGSELVRIAAAQKLVLMVNQNFRFFPAAQRAAEIVRDRELGEVASVSIAFRRMLSYPSEERAQWHYQLRQPLLADLAIHHFDLMRMVLGREPLSIYCTAPRPKWSKFRDPATAAATIKFEDGITVNWSGTWEAQPETTFSGEWHMQCQDGSVIWACRGDRDVTLDGDRLEIIRAKAGSQPEKLKRDHRFGRVGVLDAFASAISASQRVQFFPDGSDNLMSLALMEAAIKSCETGKLVEISLLK